MKLKREIFMRPNRMVHRFGEPDDPLMPSYQNFEVTPPSVKSVQMNGKGRFNSQTRGLHQHLEPYSPVCKTNGTYASFSGPRLDVPDLEGANAPQSTIMRRTEGPLIKSEKEETKGRK